MVDLVKKPLRVFANLVIIILPLIVFYLIINVFLLLTKDKDLKLDDTAKNELVKYVDRCLLKLESIR